jgi:hypothetical protein
MKPIARHSSIRPLLQRAGLNDKEAEIYLTLLSLRSARVTDIARTAKQSRSHTYLVLKSLEEKGLVSHIEQGKVLRFVAEPPHRIVHYAKNLRQQWSETERLLEGVMPLLRNLTPNYVGTPRVTTLHGIDGMKQVYRDVLLQPGFCAFFNAEVMFNAFGSNIVPMLFGTDQRLRGRELFVDNAGARRYIKEIPQDDEYEVRLLPKQMQFVSEMIIFGDTVALFAYDSELTIVKIDNQNFADTFRTFFEVLWVSAKKTKGG